MKELLLLIPFRQRPQVTDFNPENTENQDSKNALKISAHWLPPFPRRRLHSRAGQSQTRQRLQS